MRELGIVNDGAVLIEGDRILAAGPRTAVERLPEAKSAREINEIGRLVMPGFVDSHVHLFAGPRLMDYELRIEGATYGEIAAMGGGIGLSVKQMRSTSMQGLLYLWKARRRQMLRHGTTSFEAKSGYGLNERSELQALRAAAMLGAVPTFLGPHIVPTEYSSGDEYIEWLCATMLPLVRRRKLAQFVDIYCDFGAFTLEQARRYLTVARGLGFALKAHGEQFARTGITHLAIGLGAVSVDHLDQAGPQEIMALAASNTVATLLPGSVFHLGLSKYAPARALIDGGAAVALATDFNPGTSPTYSMQMVMSLACVMMRMRPVETIVAATINGAHALGRANTIGSLEPGKQADVLIFDTNDLREIPYYFGCNNVHTVIHQGEIVT